ncbi:MAG: TRAP transporter fused permease subunit [Gammaproteobacteria bacterium]|nr:TRAP transporter fused permease subunit [Gammaproteobacteria bacterium]
MLASFSGITVRAASLAAFGLGTFHLLNVAGVLALSTMEVRATHLLAVLAILYLTRPTVQGWEANPVDRAVRLACVAAAIGSGSYLLWRWEDIAYSGGITNETDALVGLVTIALVLEGARRGVGIVLAAIVAAFFAYPFVSSYLPGVLRSRGYGLERMSEFLTTTTEGIYGIPLGVSATYIILFTIYGAFLSEYGGGEFFFRLSRRVTRGMRAASAKTAVIFSTLIGMVSGSAAGNVAVTGALTIPMMKREGYASHQAGAIEAVVSTGGQIMPPVMGAAAFIMAELIGVEYARIMQAGLIPALIFFTAIFFVVHLQAGRMNLQPNRAVAGEDDEPMGRILLGGLQYMIPFFALIGLIVYGYSPPKAAFLSIVLLLVGNVLWERKIDRRFFVRAYRAIEQGTLGVVPIAVACAAAGIISGTDRHHGLGPKISALIISAAGGVPFVALVLTMLLAIVLGMGLPTTAAYLILATVIAPALVKMGVPILTAHMFVFFFGCVSTITPPVALASYVAASIAQADINKVSWTAFAYGITSYFLPFMFFFGPALLMEGTPADIVRVTVTGLISVFCIAAGVVGYLGGVIGWLRRSMLLLAGFMLLYHSLATDVAGLAILAVIWALTRRNRVASRHVS